MVGRVSVHRLVGYGRLEGGSMAQALVRRYAAARLHANVFQHSMECVYS